MSIESRSPRLATLEVDGLDTEGNYPGKSMEAECSTKCRSPSILRRPSQSSTYSDDRLSVVSSLNDTLSITLSRRSSRVRFSDIESPPVSTAMQRRGSAESPSRFDAYGNVGLGICRIRPSSLPLPSPGYTEDSDFTPKTLPTPQHSPTKSTRSPSLRRSSIDGLRADLERHRLSATVMSRRSSRLSIVEPSSRRSSARFSILVDPEDVELLAEAEPAFSPLPLRYPSQSRPNSMFIPTEDAGPSTSTRPLSLPVNLPLPPLPSVASSPRRASLPLSLPICLPPLPSLDHTASGSNPSRALSPIFDDDIDPPQPVDLDSQETDFEDLEGLPAGSPPPTGRKRETTDNSIISLSKVALFPVPPPRNLSFDAMSPVLSASPSLEDSRSEAEDVESADLEDITDNEAIVDMSSLGSSPDISEMIALMKSRQAEECDEDSEIDLHMPLTEAAVSYGIISFDSRLLRKQRAIPSVGVSRSASKPPIARSASFHDSVYPSSESEEDEVFARKVRTVTMRKLARSSYLKYKQKEEAEIAEARQKLETPMKRLSNMSTSSTSSSELLTPNPRRATFDLHYRSPLAIARESAQWATLTSKSGGEGVPSSKRYSIPIRPGRVLPHPKRQVKGWGPPEIMIYEESDDDPVALSSSDEESCLPAKDGSFNMSVHYDFDEAKIKRVASASAASRAGSVRASENDWLMDEEMIDGGEISDFDESDRLRVPGRGRRV